MFEQIEGGKIIDIQGLPCCLPPEGYIYNVITRQLEYRGIYERSSDKGEQYWEVQPYPDWYKDTMKKWDDYDKRKKEDDPDFFDEKLEKFKKDQWDKRLNGMWFMNNGIPTYITGLHWFYLSVWHIDIGLPKFRIPDLEKAYFIQYCIEDPLCMGTLEVTKRRFGKSFWAGCFLTEYITRTKMANGGVQSKTLADGKKFFGKTIVNPFRRLPKYFRPEYDMSLGVNPKTELRFQKTNVRGKKAEENIDKDELGSIIDFGSADPIHYDGSKLVRYVGDEVGKTVEANVYDRNEVVRYCLLDDEGRIIGKALLTTTVEKLETDKDGVQDAFKLLWAESDQYKKGEDGKTISGLYRFFMSAKRTRNFDKYGFPDEEKTLQQILADRETVKNNPRSLTARMRKEPLTIDEAFSSDTDKSVFNALNVDNRRKYLRENPIVKRKILFYKDLEQKTHWRDWTNKDEDFYWEVTPDFELSIKEKTFKYDGLLQIAAREHYGAISVDSYSNSQGGRKYGSKASAWIGYRHLLKPVAHLYGRPAVKETLHNQVMLAAEFCGVRAYFEHTADDFYGYFRERGKLGFLGKYPKSLIDPEKLKQALQSGKPVERFYGVPLTPFSLTRQLDNGIAYFEYHCDSIDFESVLEIAPKFDPYDRTKFDTIVSLLILISVLMEPITAPEKLKEPLISEYANPNWNGRQVI